MVNIQMALLNKKICEYISKNCKTSFYIFMEYVPSCFGKIIISEIFFCLKTSEKYSTAWTVAQIDKYTYKNIKYTGMVLKSA